MWETSKTLQVVRVCMCSSLMFQLDTKYLQGIVGLNYIYCFCN